MIIMVRLSLQTTVLLTVVYHVSATTMAGVRAISNVPKAQGKKRFLFHTRKMGIVSVILDGRP